VALLGVGVAAAAAGTYLWLRGGRRHAAAPMAWVDERGGGVAVAGGF
jgi:hypothetical protein